MEPSGKTVHVLESLRSCLIPRRGNSRRFWHRTRLVSTAQQDTTHGDDLCHLELGSKLTRIGDEPGMGQPVGFLVTKGTKREIASTLNL